MTGSKIRRSTRRLDLEHIKVVRSKGREYFYFNTGERNDGRAVYVALPHKSRPDFGTRYAQALANRARKERTLYTVADLCRDYQLSPKFRNRAFNTQKLYLPYIMTIAERFRDAKGNSWPVAVVTAKQIEGLTERYTGTAAKKMAVTVAKVLFDFAIPEHIAANPCKHVKVEHVGTEHQPWPESLIDEALGDPSVRLEVALLYFTGQRIGDVAALRWSQIENDAISTVQEKTGKPVTVPVHPRLTAILAERPRGLTTIICDKRGRRKSTDTIRTKITRWGEARGVHIVPHGLRKNAVNTLFEVGCTVAEVASITGQSLQLVEHYWKRWNAKALAKNAMGKWAEKDSA